MADFKLTYSTMFNPPEELHKGFDKAVGKAQGKSRQGIRDDHRWQGCFCRR